MMPQSPRPLSVVLVALDAAQHTALVALQQRYPSQQVRVDDSDVISPASLASNHVLHNLMRRTKEMGGRLHLLGLVSDGGVHSSLAHLFALLEIAANARVRVVVHALLDGVDVPPRSAQGYIAELERKLEGGVGRIGTVSGRAFAMDSEGRWDRIEKVFKAIMADGVDRVDSAMRGVHEAGAFGNPEAFAKPFIAFDYPGVSLVDTALHFNFRADGARQLTRALTAASFDHFARKSVRGPFNGRFLCMTPYESALGLPTLFARAPDPSSLVLDDLSSVGYKLFHCSEGSASSIAQATTEAIRSGQYQVVVADFASPDNTARSGSEAAHEGSVAAIVEAARSVGGVLLICGARDAADRFPVIYVDDAHAKARLRDDGQFCDLTPTLFELLRVPHSEDVEGTSLLVR